MRGGEDDPTQSTEKDGSCAGVMLQHVLAVAVYGARGVDYYGDLGVDRRASVEDIKASFRKQAKKYHPDRQPRDASPETLLNAEAQFKRISAAYEVLSDAGRRARYDAQLMSSLDMPQAAERAHVSCPVTVSLEDLFNGATKFVRVPGALGLEVMVPLRSEWQDGHELIARTLSGLGIRVHVHVRRHADFERHGADLIARRLISGAHRRRGRPIVIRTIDGRRVRLTPPGGAWQLGKSRIPNEGMWTGTGGRGALVLDLAVGTRWQVMRAWLFRELRRKSVWQGVGVRVVLLAALHFLKECILDLASEGHLEEFFAILAGGCRPGTQHRSRRRRRSRRRPGSGSRKDVPRKTHAQGRGNGPLGLDDAP